MYLNQQDYLAALADFSRAIELQPEDGSNYVGRGEAYFHQDNLSAALADFSRAIELQSENADAYFGRGRVYLNQQDYPAALADFSRAIELQPKDGSNYVGRGRVYLNQQDYPAAVADFSRAIELQPEDGEAYSGRSEAYVNQQDYPAAAADFSRAIELKTTQRPRLTSAAYITKDSAKQDALIMAGRIKRFTERKKGKARTKQLRQRLVNELLKYQFRPVHMVMETSQLLRHFMEPYISVLRDHTQATAYFWWEMAGHQQQLGENFWLGAEKYVDALGVWAWSGGRPPRAAGQEFERRMGMFMQAMPMHYYVKKVGQLAMQMWKDAGCPSGEKLDFWLAAENHVLTVACLTVAMANTAADSIDKLTKVFETFSPETYLAQISETAYYIWKASGGTAGHALEDWLKAERQALSRELQSPPIP